jgi:hypothetical protein
VEEIIKEMRESNIDIIGAASVVIGSATQIMPDGNIAIINEDGSFTQITDDQFDDASVLAVTTHKTITKKETA